MQASRTSFAGLVARTRPLPARKQVLFAEHEHLLTSNDLILFLRPGDFSAQEWRSLRAQLVKSATRPGSKPTDEEPSPLKLTLLRPGLLPALLRNATSHSTSSTSSETPPSSSRLSQVNLSHLSQPSHLSGPLAVVTAPTLSPPILSRILTLVTKFSQTPAPNAPPPAKGAPPIERLSLLSSLLENGTSSLNPDETKRVSKLPELNVLQAQIVGLLSAPGARITGVLGARAREVGRTVEGFKEGLRKEQEPASAEVSP